MKLKVGIGDDAGRVAAVRAAVGARVAIRVDANGAWTIDEAIATLRALAPAGIELAEEPVHGVEALRAVRAEVDVPLAMDETAAEEGAPGSGATDAVCLKIGRCGGISGVLRDAAAARLGGLDGLPGLDLRRPAGHRRRRARRRRPECERPPAGPRPGHAGRLRRARRAAARRARRDPRASRARPGGRVTITTWFLEMTAPEQLRPARPVEGFERPAPSPAPTRR